MIRTIGTRKLALRILATFTAFFVMTAALVGAWFLGLTPALGKTAFEVHKVGEASYSGEPTSGPVFFAVIGNDGRENNGGVERGTGGARGDATHLIGVDPLTHKATILNFPRDTCVPVPGHGNTRINAANAEGGIALSAETLSNLVGVDVSYAIGFNFEGFEGLVDDMGGLDIIVPKEMSDPYSGANFAAGPVHMSGAQALAFGRDRHDFPRGDITRTENQGLLILSALVQLREAGTGATGTLKGLAVIGRHATLDGIGLGELYSLARLGLSIDPADVKNITMPVASGQGCGGATLGVGAGADELFADFADNGTVDTWTPPT